MIYILVNFGPIAAATLAGLVIGYAWLAVSGIPLPGRGPVAGMVLAEFWLASILAGALILAPDGAGAWIMALASAVVIWIGFVAPIMWVTFMALGLGQKRLMAVVLHWLVVMLAQALVMQWIGLVGPPAA